MRTFVLALFTSLVVASTASAQQMIHTQTPFQGINSSFYESNGITWNLSGPNFFANFGGQVVPPFGNFDPNSGIRTGAAFSGNGLRGSIGFHAAQGSSRSMTTTVPSVTTMDGVPGSITSQTISPFVTGITPVVGGYPTLAPGQLPGAGGEMASAFAQSQQAERMQSAAKAMDAKQRKALEYFNRGQRAESEGNKRMARANYKTALAHARGELRLEVIRHMRTNGWIR